MFRQNPHGNRRRHAAMRWKRAGSFLGVAAGFALVLAGLAAAAAEYHVRPGAVAAGADGSADRPWPGLEAAFADGRIAAGDTVHLHGGAYGAVNIRNRRFDAPVTLLSDPDNPARFSMLTLVGTRNLVIDGVAVWPDPGAVTDNPTLVVEAGENSVLRRLDVRGRWDAASYPDWTAEDWLSSRGAGIHVRGRDAVVRDSRLTGVGEGIAVIGTGARIIGNTIRGFSADGLRGIGDDGLFHDNLVMDCVKVDGNHDDGFQSWSRGPDGRPGMGVVRDLTIDANTFLEWTGPSDHPLRCDLQGIGLFDGMFENLQISNNLISVSAFHGISVGGARNARIVNNTLVNARGISRQAPWVQLAGHRDGTPSAGGVVANNIAPRFLLEADVMSANQVGANHVVIYPHRDLLFDGPGTVRVKPAGPLAGTGLAIHAPALDRAGQPRVAIDGRVDPGAFTAVPAP